MSKDRTIGMWIYNNGGGDKIGKKIIKKLQDRDIETINDVRLHDCIAKNSHIYVDDLKVDKLDLMFSYNAGQQDPESCVLPLDDSPLTNNQYPRNKIQIIFGLSL